MAPQSTLHRSSSASKTITAPVVSEECLTIRNYDSHVSHEVTVRFYDADEDIAFKRSYTLSPLDVVSVSQRLDRAVYRVDVVVDEDTNVDAECLIGSGPNETALVEIGNGLLSVTEGVM
jgi:hypothetical protein